MDAAYVVHIDAEGISNEAYRQAQRNDGLHFICRQCEERNWPEISDTDADEDERALTTTDQQSMGNST
ncbi:hypothetical protein DPMN_142705 [Dreissena polymorpha]|uniref:Uncharacterized protein n=1 Tax=Dreissena polymorpha TaxID=45954 RepID=A0A9D4GEW9_DREPO|nr:hypothetical protein DPMN_142705 [Dreissena polymorpha]